MDYEFISASALLIFLLKKVLLNRMITSWSSQKQVVMQIQQFSNTFSLCICAYACACVSCWCVCVCVYPSNICSDVMDILECTYQQSYIVEMVPDASRNFPHLHL